MNSETTGYLCAILILSGVIKLLYVTAENKVIYLLVTPKFKLNKINSSFDRQFSATFHPQVSMTARFFCE
jgi:hypothetical protein